MKQRITIAETKKAIREAIKQQGDTGKVNVVLSWTSEEWLGVLRRRNIITHFQQDKEYEDGNLRKYTIEYVKGTKKLR